MLALGAMSGLYGPRSGRGRKSYNNATGGTISTFSSGGKTFRVHTFSSSGTFQVLSAVEPFDLVVAGGGGGGGGEGHYYARGGNGGAGAAVASSVTLTATSYPVVVGGGGGCCAGRLNGGPGGGSSSIAGVSASGGGGGSPGAGFAPGSPNGPQIVSSIDGTSKTYGGGGGRGWADPDWVAYGGGAGVVVVRYEVAP